MNKKIEDYSEQDLIAQLKNGDPAAFRLLYEKAFRASANLVINNQGTMDDARDMFQEGLLVLVKNLRKPDFNLTCRLSTYLYSVVRNLWLKRLRKNSKGGLSLVLDELPDHTYITIETDEIEIKKEQERLYQVVGRLLETARSDCKKLLKAFYYQQKKLQEIADEMGYTANFAKVKKNRCMDELKKAVKLQI